MEKMNVLLLSRGFFSYDNIIKTKITERGYNVFDFLISPKLSVINRIRLRQGFLNMNKIALSHQEKMIDYLSRSGIIIDIIFVVAGQYLQTSTLKRLKEMYPLALFVWYIWDDIVYLPNFIENKIWFDRVLSYNILDAQKYYLDYLPLFYTEETSPTTKKYDFCFIGSDHSSRFLFLSKIIESNKDNKFFIYILSNRINRLKCLFSKKRRMLPFLKLKPLDYNKMIDIIRQSRCVIDLPATKQNGLTMRTFESLGNKTKLLTTNQNIKIYEFYNPANIYIFDDSHLWPDESFFLEPFNKKLTDVSFYNVDCWANKIVGVFKEAFDKNGFEN